MQNHSFSGQLNDLAQFSGRLYTGLLILQNFRAAAVVLPVALAYSSFSLPLCFLGAACPVSHSLWRKYGPFLQKWALEEYFISLSWWKKMGFDLPVLLQHGFVFPRTQIAW